MCRLSYRYAQLALLNTYYEACLPRNAAERADIAKAIEKLDVINAKDIAESIDGGTGRRDLRMTDQAVKWTAYYSSLKRKYKRAARYRWLPIEPDPPEPE
jgi:hypothetical protein